MQISKTKHPKFLEMETEWKANKFDFSDGIGMER